MHIDDISLKWYLSFFCTFSFLYVGGGWWWLESSFQERRRFPYTWLVHFNKTGEINKSWYLYQWLQSFRYSRIAQILMWLPCFSFSIITWRIWEIPSGFFILWWTQQYIHIYMYMHVTVVMVWSSFWFWWVIDSLLLNYW